MAHGTKKQGLKPLEKHIGIHSAAELQAILRYERARADRAGNQFAIVTVDSRSQLSNKHEIAKLIQTLRQRVRTTDVLGWLDDHTLSVLLPGTDLKGALVFAGNLQKQYSSNRPPISMTVYCYPDHWLQTCKSPDTSKHDPDQDSTSGFTRVQRKIESTLSRRIPVYKRSLDIIVALIALILCSPLFLILASYIKIVSRGSVFFKQKRIGYRASPFTFFKFRTMHANNDPHCHQILVKDFINSDKPMEKLDNISDLRIIPGGRIIRKACIDELPQLFNVLKGEMSMVGPRPCLPYEAEEYLRWHSHRFDVMPGLTGLWQVSGKNKLTFKQMIRLDISYCQNMSFLLDLKIILLTFPTIAGLVLEGLRNRLNRSVQMPAVSSIAENINTSHLPKSIAEHI